jgi:hypothetical protein
MSREAIIILVLTALVATGVLRSKRGAKNRKDGEKRGKLS